MSRSFAIVAVLATLPVVASAGGHRQDEKAVTRQNQVTATATVTAIDQATPTAVTCGWASSQRSK